jgi:DNA-binding transcriptional MerR regulator
MKFEIVIHPARRDDEPIFSRQLAAQMAHVSEDFLRMCEEEQLLRARPMPGGSEGFSRADVRELARIRRLYAHLDLDLAAIDVVLHLRRKVVNMMAEIDRMEQRMVKRERELMVELRRLRRRMAMNGRWE